MRRWLAQHGMLVSILLAVSVIFFVAALGTFAWPPRRPSSNDAVVWTAAFAAAGTLFAVWASLQNAQEAARSADIAAQNAAMAIQIARETSEREERRRHDAVHPNISAALQRTFTRADPHEHKQIAVNLFHESGQAGFDLTVELLTDSGDIYYLGPERTRDIVLRPVEIAIHRADSSALDKDSGRATYRPVRFTCAHKGLVDQRARVRVTTVDSLGWRWEYLSGCVPLTEPAMDYLPADEPSYDLIAWLVFVEAKPLGH